MILVIGANGTIGSEVARQLVAAGQMPRLLVRDLGKARAFEGKAEVLRADLNDSTAVSKALIGCDRIFLSTSGLDGPRLEAKTIDAAKTAGIKHVVKLSIAGAETEVINLMKWHRGNEKKLESSGMSWTFLRPSNFMSNAMMWVDTIKKENAIYAPLGGSAFAPIDPVDVAAVAVKALTIEGHEGKAYVLTGPASLDMQTQAEVVGHVLGRKVKYVDITPATAREGLLKIGIPDGYVHALMELYAEMKAGKSAAVTSTVQDIAGRPPASFEQFLVRHVGAFR
jgi:(4-alkanoyl-5-oxo-2,5-dihydrofuran-3-yl)methyl phosphate reductase